jgi:hypothetical protein
METITGFAWLVVLLGIYFAPTLIAFQRTHVNAAPILVVNLFLGWTLIGWVISFAWSVSPNTKPKHATKS